MDGFADIPAEIRRWVRAGEKPVVVLLDAFGRRSFEKSRNEHPLLRRFVESGRVVDLESQFPSTTAAHVTTMHTGAPVGEHGVYEWRIFDPSVGAVIRPLRVETEEHAAALLTPGPTLYERLAADGARSFVFQPTSFSPSPYDAVAVRGARLSTYTELPDAVASALRSVAGVDRGYAFVYHDAVDTAGHEHGPSSATFTDVALRALDSIEQGVRDAGPSATGALLALTADHGQIDVDPSATLWLDELAPELAAQLTHKPAGSARDVFLHVADGAAVVEELGDVLGDAARVELVSDLLERAAFGATAGHALLARLGDVCVLPEAGRMAWLRGSPSRQTNYRGHHGGLSAEETQTYLATLRLG